MVVTKESLALERRLARRARRKAEYRQGLRPMAIAGWNTSKEYNIGSLVRTAHAAAVEEVILIGERDWNVEAAKTSELYTEITILPDAESFLRHIRERGFQLVAVELDRRAVNLFDAEYPERPCFVLGGEREGLPDVLRDAAELIVEVPQWGLVPCLNVAVAGSIVLFDFLGKQARAGRLRRPDGGLVTD